MMTNEEKISAYEYFTDMLYSALKERIADKEPVLDNDHDEKCYKFGLECALDMLISRAEIAGIELDK